MGGLSDTSTAKLPGSDRNGSSSIGSGTECKLGIILGNLTAVEDHTSTMHMVHQTRHTRSARITPTERQEELLLKVGSLTSYINLSFEATRRRFVREVQSQGHSAGQGVVEIFNVGVTVAGSIAAEQYADLAGLRRDIADFKQTFAG